MELGPCKACAVTVGWGAPPTSRVPAGSPPRPPVRSETLGPRSKADSHPQALHLGSLTHHAGNLEATWGGSGSLTTALPLHNLPFGGGFRQPAYAVSFSLFDFNFNAVENTQTRGDSGGRVTGGHRTTAPGAWREAESGGQGGQGSSWAALGGASSRGLRSGGEAGGYRAGATVQRLAGQQHFALYSLGSPA